VLAVTVACVALRLVLHRGSAGWSESQRRVARLGDMLLVLTVVGAWIDLLFVGFGAGYPFRSGGLEGYDGGSPVDDFVTAYLAPFGFLAIGLPPIGPTVPVLAVAAGLVAAVRRGIEPPLRVGAAVALILLVAPYPYVISLSEDGPGGRGIGGLGAPGLPGA
jgi:hypothetical protein